MPDPAPSRLLAVGASNLERMALAVLDAERAHRGGAVAMHAACGFGRSFCMRSRFLVRGLGPIDACPLWAVCPPDRELAARTTALLMDVGNDLLYGLDPARILDTVERVLGMLAARAHRRIVVGLPITTIRTVTRRQFLWVRTLLVPSSRLPYAAALQGAERLHEGLRALAAQHDAAFQEHRPQWYGFDPMHVRRRDIATAARTWLQAGTARIVPPTDTWAGRLGFAFAAPCERTWFGITQRCKQPARRWLDGSTLSLW